MILSIMIPTVKVHEAFLGALLVDLKNQILPYNGEIEILIDDNETDSTGLKRQRLLEKANGEYVVSIDSDDEVMPYYIEEILKACESGADCIGTNGWMTTNGANIIEWRLSKDYDDITIFENDRAIYLRHTNHISPVKRSIALQSGFPDISKGEDRGYSQGLKGLLHTEATIDLPIYHYKFSTFNKLY